LKKLVTNFQSINGYVCCNVCESDFKLSEEIPAICSCGTALWGIVD